MTQAIPTWLRANADGFYIIPADAWLDPNARVSRAIISHAHGDHYAPIHGEVYATPETLALGEARLGNRSGRKKHPKNFGEIFSISDCSFTFIPAGHILGSAQILIEYKGETILYSGDIGIQPQLTCEGIEYPDFDSLRLRSGSTSPGLLICESTFGEKEDHKTPVEALQKTITESGLKPLLIGVYPLGKAQEINRLFSDHFPEIKIFVHGEILKYHHVYEKYGHSPGTYFPYNRREVRKESGKFAVLVPARMISSYARDNDYFKVLASGFNQKKKYTHLDGHLEISGHASGNDLRNYIEKINPASILFWHGYPAGLTSFCKERNIPAYQLTLQQIRPLW